MKNILKAFTYLRNHKGLLSINVLLSFITSFLEVVSLMAIIPLLQILFSDAYSSKPVAPAEEVEGKLNKLNQLKEQAEAWYGNLVANNDRADVLFWICLAVFASFLLKNLLIYIIRLIDAKIRYSVSRDLRKNLFQKIIHLPITQLREKNKGDLLTRFSADINEVENMVGTTMDMAFRQPIMILFYILSMLFISVKLTLFVFILIPVLGIVIGRISKSLRKANYSGLNQLSKLTSFLDEVIFGSKIVKAFNAEDQQTQRFDKENQKLYRLNRKIYARYDSASPVSEFLGICVVLIVIWVGGNMIFNGNQALGASSFIAFIILFARMNTPLKAFSKNYTNLMKALAAGQRIEEVQQIHNPIQDAVDAVPLTSFEQGIAINNVTFGYTEDRDVLKNMSISVPKGHMVALVGQSGAGKTTIADLIPRFYDVQTGSITLDGIDIRKIQLQSLREQLGIVTQDAILFNDSILNNILLGRPSATKEEVIEAAKVANAHDFIEQSEQGYDTIIGEGGSKLSGGQRQRLTIARAILKNPPILILDEATSALDTESERLVQEALENLMKDRTSVVIAHRLSTIQNADHIYVLQDGEVLEEGSHEALLAKSGGYSNLVKLQTIAK
ncbi:MAG: ABC transporter ATP-binding protein/permease [Saprospiraceae bacterium]|nr:ABC transporter ATP-binding protein/permease [Saprospiraceae bacterium]